MARRRDYDEEMTQTGRISPYDQIPEEEYDDGYDDGTYEEYDDQAYDGEYDDQAYDDESYEDGEYEDEEYDEAYDGEYEDEEDDEGGLLSSLPAKIILAVIVLLIVVLAALLAMRLLKKPGSDQKPADQTVTAGIENQDNSIVFAPIENTPEPTAEPTAVPEPTATELPIILTNTPTPSPTATPTPTPSPTPVPTPTPTPAPTKVPELSKGEVNRNANLRESATANGKVKQTVKDGEAVTIHEAILDKTGKIWYGLTVDDLEITGWMRDYVVDTEEKIPAPTYTPKPETTPGEDDEETKKEENTSKALNENAIGTGKTNKDANIRKIMNGKVITQLRKGRRVDILSVKMDKNGDLWYEVQPQGLSTIGFVRDYLVTLDRGVELILPTATPKAEKTPAPDDEKDEADESEDNADVEDTKKEGILDREVIGRARTNRAANVRVEPKSGAKLVRQLSKGNWLHILAVYEDSSDALWYEVATESGKTSGFVRDYVVELHEINDGVEPKVYGEETTTETAEEE